MTPWWVFLLAFPMGALGWLTAHVGNKMFNARVLKRNAWQRWLFRAEEDSVALIHAATESAVRKQSLADLVLEVPEPFEGAVMELSRFGYTFEQAALQVAAERGVFHLCDPAYYRAPRPAVAPEVASCDPPVIITMDPASVPRLPVQGSPSTPPPPIGIPQLESAVVGTGMVWSPSVGAFVRR